MQIAVGLLTSRLVGPSIRTGWNDLCARLPVACDSEGLARLLNPVDQAETLGFEFRDRDVLHDHYFN
jgi:hypothetical protein